MNVQAGKTVTLVVKSPAGVLFEQRGLRSVQLDLRDGKIGIRVGHAAMIAEVSDGEAVMNDGENIRKMAHHSGIVVVQGDVVTIYTDALDAGDVKTDAEVDRSEEKFNFVYEAIMASLLPDSVQAESQHDS
jgi:F0F1-type ATP synthase epsilon subunit